MAGVGCGPHASRRCPGRSALAGQHGPSSLLRALHGPSWPLTRCPMRERVPSRIRALDVTDPSIVTQEPIDPESRRPYAASEPSRAPWTGCGHHPDLSQTRIRPGRADPSPRRAETPHANAPAACSVSGSDRRLLVSTARPASDPRTAAGRHPTAARPCPPRTGCCPRCPPETHVGNRQNPGEVHLQDFQNRRRRHRVPGMLDPLRRRRRG